MTLHVPSWITDFSFGIMDYWPFRILYLLWFVISMLPRCLGSTRPVGLIFEDISEKLGIFLNAAMVLFSVTAVFLKCLHNNIHRKSAKKSF